MSMKALVTTFCMAAMAAAAAGQESLADLFAPPVGKVHRISSASLDNSSNVDFMPLAAGAEITLGKIKGSGVIRRFWLTFESDEPYANRLLVLRARWDGESLPSIEVPVGDFFACGNALEADVDTLPIHVASDGRARVSYWPMPFNESAELSLRNDSGRPARLVFWQIDWTDAPKCADLRTFHALFRVSARDGQLRQHRVIDITGSGHYVGTVLSIWSGEEGWPGEGDDRIFIDQADLPTLVGTGFEGYFDEAWGFRVGTSRFGGVPIYEGTGAGARTTACRFHLLDPIPFEKHFALTFERQGYARRNGVMQLVNDRNDAFSSVAFWYQAEPHSPLPILPTVNERLPFAEARVEPEEKDVFAKIEVAEGAPPAAIETGPFLAYGKQVVFSPGKREQGVLAFPFDVPGPRDYDLYARFTRGPTRGVWQCLVDDEPIGPPIDLYLERAALREVLLGRLNLKTGGHTFMLRCTGKNLEATGQTVGLDSFMLRWYP